MHSGGEHEEALAHLPCSEYVAELPLVQALVEIRIGLTLDVGGGVE
jgi:hypothetical protein